MQNYDERILRGRTIVPDAPFPVLHQALRIAMYDEYAARAFYARVIEAFGPRPPFVAIQRAEQRHVEALAELCQRLGVPQPLDPFPQATGVEPTWLGNCERAVAGELANVRLYEHLLARVAEPEARQVFVALQNASLQHHLPAFVQAVQEARAQERYHAARGIPPQHAYVRHGAVSDLLERLFVQLGPHAGPLGVVSPFLRHLHPAMLAGMLTGGAGVYLWKHLTGQAPKED